MSQNMRQDVASQDVASQDVASQDVASQDVVDQAPDHPKRQAVLSKPSVSNMGSSQAYQDMDQEIINYNLWNLWTSQSGFSLRGPKPGRLEPGTYCTSLGAAYTFGRFVQRPYVELLGIALQLPSLNLGFAGVGPSFYNDPQNQALIDLVNNSKFVTIAIFSGRSQANSRFKTAQYSQEQYILENGDSVPADFAYQQLLETATEQEIAALVAETRAAYLHEFSQLLARIRVPKVLLWFSKREPHYESTPESVFTLLSGFPHMVNQPMIDLLRPQCDAYIEHTSRTGLPQPLMSRHSQQPVSIVRPRTYEKGKLQLTPSKLTHNHYYASPQMHKELAQRLVPETFLFY